MDEYMQFAVDLDPLAGDIYRYLNFDEIESFQKSALKAKSKIEEIPVSVVN
jgi:aconitate hydratase 2/2-methylisocitrate dehydratase